MVPTAALPPLMPLTLQVTAEFVLVAPLTVAVKFTVVPGVTFTATGVMLTAIALWTCTVADALARGSLAAVAVMVRLADGGMAEGAVYNPPAEIVPVAALPPATPFTLQFTAAELAPVTVAVNCTVAPSITVAFCGEMVTITLGGVF